jgi:hypothetical protein
MYVLGSVLVVLVILGCDAADTSTSSSATATPCAPPGTPCPPTATPPPPTATPSIPSGFQKYSQDPNWTIGYPVNWAVAGQKNGVSGVNFTGTTDQFFDLTYGPSDRKASEAITSACQDTKGATTPSTTISLGGQNWAQIMCTYSGGAPPLTVEAINYKGLLYIIIFGWSGAPDGADVGNYFSPMEQTFQFLTGVPKDFQKYTDDPHFSISYPAGWSKKVDSGTKIASFNGGGDQFLGMIAFESDLTPASVLVSGCHNQNGVVQQQANVVIGGQVWEQVICQTDPTSQVVTEAANPNGIFYSIVYSLHPDTAEMNQALYFSPMERSFQFKG